MSYGYLRYATNDDNDRSMCLDICIHGKALAQSLAGRSTPSLIIPVGAEEQLPSALALGPAEFLAVYRFLKPTTSDIIVLHSRTGRRAAWAAQVCADAGFRRCVR